MNVKTKGRIWNVGATKDAKSRRSLRTFPQKHAGRMRSTKEVGNCCGVYVRAESPDPQSVPKKRKKTDGVGLKRLEGEILRLAALAQDDYPRRMVILPGMAAKRHIQHYHKLIVMSSEIVNTFIRTKRTGCKPNSSCEIETWVWIGIGESENPHTHNPHMGRLAPNLR